MLCISRCMWHFGLENWKEKLRSFFEETSGPRAIFSVMCSSLCGMCCDAGNYISEEFLSSLKEGEFSNWHQTFRGIPAIPSTGWPQPLLTETPAARTASTSPGTPHTNCIQNCATIAFWRIIAFSLSFTLFVSRISSPVVRGRIIYCFLMHEHNFQQPSVLAQLCLCWQSADEVVEVEDGCFLLCSERGLSVLQRRFHIASDCIEESEPGTWLDLAPIYWPHFPWGLWGLF